MKKPDSGDQDRGPEAQKVELEKRLDANTKLEKVAAGEPVPKTGTEKDDDGDGSTK